MTGFPVQAPLAGVGLRAGVGVVAGPAFAVTVAEVGTLAEEQLPIVVLTL
jgi:hypothetical protein